MQVSGSGRYYPTDHAGLEILPFDVCLRRLAAVPVGRVSFLAYGEIIVLPVNHAVDGQDPVFRTTRGRSCPRPKARIWWHSRPTNMTSRPSPDTAHLDKRTANTGNPTQRAENPALTAGVTTPPELAEMATVTG
jgi:hypothetical protein